MKTNARKIALGSGLVLALALGAGAVFYKTRPRPVPAHTLFQATLPGWQVARFRTGSDADAAVAVQQEAKAWPALAAQLARLDKAWPDEAGVRDAAEGANRAALAAGLPYFLDVQHVREQPVVLTYEVVSRRNWRAGPQEVTALRVRRLDKLNVELAMLGETQGGVPRVLLDRIEASLTHDLPLLLAPPGAAAPPTTHMRVNGVDRAAFARMRGYLEAQLGAAALADAVAKLSAREALVEEMRGRFHGGTVQLARPDGFVLGEAWVSSMEPHTRVDRPGGPLLLDTDLRKVARADEALRTGDTAETLRRALDLYAAATDVHEVRHALDSEAPPAPPPLRALFSGSDERFPKMAGLELRAYLAELNHGAPPPCVTAAKLVRTVYGATARRTAHFFASYLILTQINESAAGAEPPGGEQQLATLCAMPEPVLRELAAKMWQQLYGTTLVPARLVPEAVR